METLKNNSVLSSPSGRQIFAPTPFTYRVLDGEVTIPISGAALTEQHNKETRVDVGEFADTLTFFSFASQPAYPALSLIFSLAPIRWSLVAGVWIPAGVVMTPNSAPVTIEVPLKRHTVYVSGYHAGVTAAAITLPYAFAAMNLRGHKTAVLLHETE